MGLYRYKAQDEQGKTVTGTLQAQDEQELHDKLKQDNKYLLESKLQVEKKKTSALKANEISAFSKNIGELLGSGVTLVKALRIVSEDESIKPKERDVYSDLLKKIKTGLPLSEALIEEGDAFPPLFINMVKSAESSGNMDKIALQMATHYDKEYRLNQKVKSSMTYPKILSGLLVAAVAVVMGYVIPQFDDLFSKMDSLPLPTTILLAISNIVTKRWYALIIGAIIIYILFKVVFSIPAVRMWKDKMIIRLPVIGKLQKVIYTARFARTMSSLYVAGLSMLNCLQIARNTIGNRYIERQFDQVISDVRGGMNLSDAVKKVDGFTKKISSSIAVGEETGALDRMLISVADQLDYDAEMALNKMVSFLEPGMIVVMAVVIGFVIISVIQPIYGSYESISAGY